MAKNSLILPPSTVRGLISILIVLTGCALAFTQRQEALTVFAGLIGTVLGYWLPRAEKEA